MTTAQKEQRLWSNFWRTHADADRNALIEHFLPLIRFAALRMASQNGRSAKPGDVDELKQYGALGLRDAIGKFDPSRGVKFETYCMTRIRGAMLDGMKTNRWIPRDLRRQVREYASVQDQLEAEHGAGIDPGMVASRLGVDREVVHDLRAHCGRMSIASLHGMDNVNDTPAASHIADHHEEEPAETQQRQDVRDMLLRELTRTERQLMMLYYYEDMTMREIGEVLNISATRVSQIHSDVVKRLRESLASRVTGSTGQAPCALNL